MSFRPDQSFANGLHRDGVDFAGPSKYDESFFSEIQRRLEKASMVQQEIGGSREDLIIKREVIRSSAKSLRTQRVKTGDAEASLMSAFRRLFNEQRDELPQYLNAAYIEVEAARDKLGAMEEDYLQAERTLSGSEWTFMEKESDFYQFDLQRLFADLVKGDSSSLCETKRQVFTPPTPPAQELLSIPTNKAEDYKDARVEFDGLRKQFEDLRIEQSKVFDVYKLPRVRNVDAGDTISQFDILPQHNDLIESLIASQVKLQHLKQHKAVCENIDRRRSDPMLFNSASSIPLDPPSRAHTESAMNTKFDHFSTLSKIREWLLDCLKSSVIEKTIYFSILESWEIDHQDEWQQQASQYWTTDSSEQGENSQAETEPSTRGANILADAYETEDLVTRYHLVEPSSDQSVTTFAPNHDITTEKEAIPTFWDNSKPFDLPLSATNILQNGCVPKTNVNQEDLLNDVGVEEPRLVAPRMGRCENSMHPGQRNAAFCDLANLRSFPKFLSPTPEPSGSQYSCTDLRLRSNVRFGKYSNVDDAPSPRSRSERGISLVLSPRDTLRMRYHTRAFSTPATFCTQYVV